MKFFYAVSAGLLASTATASPALVGRSASSIISALNNIGSALSTLSANLNTFSGSTVQALQIQSQSGTLDQAIKDATTTTQQSASLNDADSAAVAFGVAGLQSGIYGTISLLVAKKPAFDQAILGVASAGPLVYYDLVTLKNDTDKLGAAVISKVTTPIVQIAPLLVGDIDFHFNQAIAAYSGDL